MSPLELNKYAASYRKTLAENPDNQEINGSIAMCYLKLKLYDNAIKAFEKAVEENFDKPETFYYAAVSLLKGKKAFLCPRSDIDKAIQYLNSALMIEESPLDRVPRGMYHYFLAYIKYDYFERKYLNIKPNWQETLQTAIQNGVSAADIGQLAEVLQVEIPACLEKSL
jgi:tetratricopeptide (TPR) repeat protein